MTVKSIVPEFVNIAHSSRVSDVDGVDLVNSDFDGSDVDIFIYNSANVLVYSLLDQAIAGYLSDTLTTGGRWGNKDSVGYNFTSIIDQDTVAAGVGGQKMQGGETYLTVYILKTVSKGWIPLKFEDYIEPVKPV